MPNALVRGAEKAQVWNRAGIKAQKSSAENTEKAKYITTSWLGEKKKIPLNLSQGHCTTTEATTTISMLRAVF